MIRARVPVALTGLLILGALPVASQRATAAKNNAPADLRAFFKDTGSTNNGLGSLRNTRTFDLRTLGQRDSLRATLRKERDLWRAGGVRDYRFLLRVGCFCPRTRGWLLMDVRSGQPLRAWDRAGQAAPIIDWNTFSIEVLFDNMLRSADVDRLVKIAFDPRRHFPTFVYAVGSPGPDVWVTIETRGVWPSPIKP